MQASGEPSSDEFSGRLGLIFATIGAAIGTGNIWRFPRMVGANGGGSFLVPWLIFLFLWSVPLIIAEFASLTEAKNWANDDPFYQCGVYEKIEVKPFKKTLP